MILYPNAKINIGLNVVEKRADGYHNLETVFYPINLLDALEITTDEHQADSVKLKVSGEAIAGRPSDNLVMKACNLMRSMFPEKIERLSVHLHKHIPTGAGLGGGSSDAAFTIKALNEKFSLGMSVDQMEQLSAQLGADCPFFIKNQPVFAEGIGDIFTDIDINRLRFDAMCACCYKGLLGPEGVGFIYVRDELLRGLVPVFSGASAGTSLDRQTMEVTFKDLSAAKLEAGTLPFIGIYMLEKGLDRLLSIGMANIMEHIRECFNVIRNGLTEAGYETAFEYTDGNSCHSMLIKVGDCDEAYRYFTELGVYVSKSLNDTLRVSVAPFTTEKSN